jgi:aspartate/methionine/tyrosine aminotransferase
MQSPPTNTQLIARIQKIIDISGTKLTFVSAIEKVYAASSDLLSPELQRSKRKLSSGVSDIKAYDRYLRIAVKSIENHTNYRNYASPQGDISARKALAISESIKFNDSFAYGEDNFCITEGATGAISSVLEYIKQSDAHAELLIPCPSYYAFKLCAQQYNLAYKEIRPEVNGKPGERMISMDTIIQSISPQTRVIALTQPNNPTGEIYTREEVAQLMRAAVEKNILVIADELFSDLIMDSTNEFTATDKIAHELNTLKNLVCIKAYSKNRNLPGFRIGYLYSADNRLIEKIVKAQETRAFCASGSNFKEVIILDSFYQTVDQLRSGEPGAAAEETVLHAKQLYEEAHVDLPYDLDDLLEGYLGFVHYMSTVLQYYQKSFDVVRKAFGDSIDYMPDTKTAFNTVVRIKDFDDINQFDFCVNLFVFYGVKAQVGPYFGFNQKVWQDELGFWLRISFSTDPTLLKDAAERLIRFKEDYRNNPGKFIHLNYEFN